MDVDAKTLTQERKRRRELAKALTELTTVVSGYLNRMDRVMSQPESRERGKAMAELVNMLDLANDQALHFALGKSLEAIAAGKRKGVM